MREDELKRALRLVYPPPQPRGKRAFLKDLAGPQMTMLDFFLSQVGYIRLWGWLLSLGIFAAALSIMGNWPVKEIWMVSALLPFAALSTVAELNRSARYQMAELEMAARFSLKTVLLARLSLLGFGNLLLLALLFPLVLRWGPLPLTEAGVYVLCPYCLTAVLCLAILRRRRGDGSIFLCAGAAASVSLLFCLSDRLSPLSQVLSALTGNGGITLLLLALTVWEYRTYLKGEAYAWN